MSTGRFRRRSGRARPPEVGAVKRRLGPDPVEQLPAEAVSLELREHEERGEKPRSVPDPGGGERSHSRFVDGNDTALTVVGQEMALLCDEYMLGRIGRIE